MKNDLVFCTLFDINYIDKACTMYDSMESFDEGFKLYILCMDEKVYDVLSQMRLSSVILVHLSQVMDDALEVAKSNRSRGEFCWTCTSYIIQYVLEHYNEEICTYIDADMFFYSSPKVLLEEFNTSNASIGIIEHRFNNNLIGRKSKEISGTYCVEFNTFKNDNEGMKALKWWMKSCLNECSSDSSNKNLGDQTYVEDFPKLFNGVYVYKNLGAGMAPWNISQYSLCDNGNVVYKSNPIVPVFYHFHGITYFKDYVTIGVFYRAFRNDIQLIDTLYKEYLSKIERKRSILRKEFGLRFNYEDLSRKVTTETRKRDAKYYIKKITNPFVLFLKARIYLTKRKDTFYFSELDANK